MATQEKAPAIHKKGYKVKDDEKNTVIAMIEQHEWHGGKKISTPREYKTNPRQWALFLANRKSQGLKVNEVLYAPHGCEVLTDPEEVDKWTLTALEKKNLAKQKAKAGK